MAIPTRAIEGVDVKRIIPASIHVNELVSPQTFDISQFNIHQLYDQAAEVVLEIDGKLNGLRFLPR